MALEANDKLNPFQTYPSTLPPGFINGCLQYRLSVMTPRMIPSSGVQNPYLDAWLPVSMNSPMLFNALLFSSLTHKRTHALLTTENPTNFIDQDDSLLLLCQQETISRTNQALGHRASAVADSTILAVVMMTETVNTSIIQNRHWTGESPFKPPLQGLQWLNIHGARVPNMSHQAGLCKLVALKGGLQNILIPGAASAIFYRALVNSTLTLSQPQLPFFSVYRHENADMGSYFGPDSALFNDGVHEFQQYGLPPNLAYVLQGMKAYSDSIRKYIDGETGIYDTRPMCDMRNLVHYHVMALPAGNELSVSQTNILYEACRLASIIYSVGVLFPIPYVGSPLQQLAVLLERELSGKELLECFSVPEQDYKVNVVLWILTMGGIAATHTAERPWFVQKLAELRNRASICEWSEFRALLRSFPWLGCACDSAGERIWEEIEIEISTSKPRAPPEEKNEVLRNHRYSSRPQPCVDCSRRRVKCDKKMPCQNCVRLRLSCSYKSARTGQTDANQTGVGRTHACELCRRRKVKCDGRSPCGGCMALGSSCTNNLDSSR
ncbi:hypothetical protein BDW59DRAFT_171795 [Aspergillus cavernicola]|uniref:Zn(2)-C6 fungal-type domain-containing protein n=1 Tax=Aspergillus cavernicola TaxID=176166 RepID=A0ABR4IG58_9EURO